MNDRQIKAFLEAARLLNFTKAAEKLYVPQSQVSRAIAALEKELGTVLFERENSRSITLSPAGEKYFSLFSRFETELGRTRESLREETHELRLGYNIGWNISGFLPEVVMAVSVIVILILVEIIQAAGTKLSAAQMKKR